MGPIRHVGPLLEFSATPGRGVWGPRRDSASTPPRSLAEAARPSRVDQAPTAATPDSRTRAIRWRGSGCSTSASGVAGPFAGRGAGRLGRRRHQGARAARYLLVRHAHGSRDQPRQAKHRAEPEGPTRAGGARAAALPRRTSSRPTGGRAPRPAAVWTTSRCASATRGSSIATPGDMSKGRDRICPEPIRPPPPSPAPNGRTVRAMPATRRCGAAPTWATRATRCSPPSPSRPRSTTVSAPARARR